MRTLSALGILLLLAACGGGSSSSAPWSPGVFQSATRFASLCAAPRTGVDPYTRQAYPDRKGSVLDENNWLRSWSNDLYLWFDEITDQNPANFASTGAYFDVLKTTAITPSGAPKDKFHFTYATAQWEALSQTGTQAGYGTQWAVIAARPPRRVLAAYTEPGSPAATAVIARGAEVQRVDGIDVVNAADQASVDTINAGLFPVAAGESHTLRILDAGAAAPRDVTLVSADVVSHPVQNVSTIASGGGSVGYMLFNDHLATSEAALVDAFAQLQAAAVTDLVLDIRYNGGGYLDIASEVAYMIAGPGPTAGMTFELTQFNSKHPATDPVSGQTIVATPFHNTTQGFSTTQGQALPTLSLPRVFLLTGPDTCSASEAIINGLRGVGVSVIQVGSTTCGKPYGFYPQDNCGTTYFSIEFRGVNAADFGDYTDGFAPQNAPLPVAAGAMLPGCSVADDFTHALGDPAEARLAAALNFRANPGSCPLPATGLAKSLRTQQASAVDGRLVASPLRQLRLLRR